MGEVTAREAGHAGCPPLPLRSVMDVRSGRGSGGEWDGGVGLTSDSHAFPPPASPSPAAEPEASPPTRTWLLQAAQRHTGSWVAGGVVACRSAVLSPFTSAAYYAHHPWVAVREVLCGITVALMMVPESVAFSLVAHVPPYVGLYSTFFVGLLTAVFGGKPGMTSGMAGALVVVSAAFMVDGGALAAYTPSERFQHYLLVMVFVGLFQLVVGVTTLSRLVRLVPRPVHVGFLNGLAIVIFMTQLEAFKTCPVHPFTACAESSRQWMRLDDPATWMALAYVAVTMLIVILFPRIPRVGKVVPSSLVAIVLCTLFEHVINRRFIHVPTRSVGDTASVNGPLPQLALPQQPTAGWAWGVVMQYAVMIALVGLVESLLTLQALNNLTKTPQHLAHFHQESVAQGVGNLVSALFGSVGGCAMVGESVVSISSGARGRLSSIVMSLGVLLAILVAHPAIELVPITCLTGVLFVGVLRTFDWATFKTIPRIPVTDTLTILITTILAVVTNLAIAVAAGVAFTALAHSWREGNGLTIRYGDRVHIISGKLSFATAWAFETGLEARMDQDPAMVWLDFAASDIVDYSGLHAVYKVVKDYGKAGKQIRLVHVNATTLAMLKRAGKMINKGASVVAAHIDHLEEGIQESSAHLGAVAIDPAAQAAVGEAVDVVVEMDDDQEMGVEAVTHAVPAPTPSEEGGGGGSDSDACAVPLVHHRHQAPDDRGAAVGSGLTGHTGGSGSA